MVADPRRKRHGSTRGCQADVPPGFSTIPAQPAQVGLRLYRGVNQRASVSWVEALALWGKGGHEITHSDNRDRVHRDAWRNRNRRLAQPGTSVVDGAAPRGPDSWVRRTSLTYHSDHSRALSNDAANRSVRLSSTAWAADVHVTPSYPRCWRGCSKAGR